MQGQSHLYEKAKLALQNTLIHMPHLAGLVEQINLQLDDRLPSAGIFPSGRLLFNPEWLDELTMPEVTFVMAHELMHLILQTHSRVGSNDPKLFNIAHDIIINYMLEQDMGMETPANGLTYKMFFNDRVDRQKFTDTCSTSLEEVVMLLKEKGNQKRIDERKCWERGMTNSGKKEATLLGDALKRAFGEESETAETASSNDNWDTDVLDAKTEGRMFPNDRLTDMEKQTIVINKSVFDAMSKKEMHDLAVQAMKHKDYKGTRAGNRTFTYEALKNHYAPPWHWALQQWMETTAPGQRTYARPSRRGQSRQYVRPGKIRIGHTLHIVLDTSGSMSKVIPKALGVIGSFCQTTNVDTIRLLQCDSEVSADDWVDIDQLKNYEIRGFGGSDMSPGMNRLAADPEVERAIVITDGYIDYPENIMPYQVLWVLTEEQDYYNDSFKPKYGKVICIEH